jgi:hypothetical protein
VQLVFFDVRLDNCNVYSPPARPHIGVLRPTWLAAWPGRAGGGVMDTMFGLQVLFASVVCMTTALTFMELRRLRKKLR